MHVHVHVCAWCTCTLYYFCQVETLGDAVSMVASGLTESKERHADGLALIAFDLVRQTQNVARMPVIRQNDVTLNLKIGTDRVLRPVWSIRCG